MRYYSISFESVSVTAIQDLITGQVGNVPAFARILRLSLQNADVSLTMPAAQQLVLSAGYIISGSQGGGGGTPNVSKQDQNDTGSAMAPSTNATSRSTGTRVQMWSGACNIFQGMDLILPVPIILTANMIWYFGLETDHWPRSS